MEENLTTQPDITEFVNFDEASHKYTGDITGREYISTTTLMKKFGISADYQNIPANVLQQAAVRGTNTHKAFENYIKSNGTILAPVNGYGFTEVTQLDTLIKYNKINLTISESEKRIYDNHYLVAGTIDWIYYDDLGNKIIADFKTTSSIHREAVSWQLSIYNYIEHKGNLFDYYATKLKVYQFYQGKMNVEDVPCIEYAEVEKLLNAHITNGTYTYVPDTSSIISNGDAVILGAIQSELTMYEQKVYELKKRKEELLKPILIKMETSQRYEVNVPVLDNTGVDTGEYMHFKYSKPSVRTTPDMVKIKAYIESHGDTVEDFYKKSNVDAHIKLSTLEKKN